MRVGISVAILSFFLPENPCITSGTGQGGKCCANDQHLSKRHYYTQSLASVNPSHRCYHGGPLTGIGRPSAKPTQQQMFVVTEMNMVGE